MSLLALYMRCVCVCIWKGPIGAERYERALEKHLLHADVCFRKAFVFEQHAAKLQPNTQRCYTMGHVGLFLRHVAALNTK